MYGLRTFSFVMFKSSLADVSFPTSYAQKISYWCSIECRLVYTSNSLVVHVNSPIILSDRIFFTRCLPHLQPRGMLYFTKCMFHPWTCWTREGWNVRVTRTCDCRGPCKRCIRWHAPHACFFGPMYTYPRYTRTTGVTCHWLGCVRPSPHHSPGHECFETTGWLVVLFAMGTKPCTSWESLHGACVGWGRGRGMIWGARLAWNLPWTLLYALSFVAHRSASIGDGIMHAWCGGVAATARRPCYWKIWYICMSWTCLVHIYQSPHSLSFPRCTVQVWLTHVIMCVSVSTLIHVYPLCFAPLYNWLPLIYICEIKDDVFHLTLT